MTGKGFTEGVTFYLGRMTGVSQVGKEESSPPPDRGGAYTAQRHEGTQGHGGLSGGGDTRLEEQVRVIKGHAKETESVCQ